MRSLLLIARRDLGSFFSSPVFYVLTTVFLILHGFIFFNILNFFSYQSLQAAQMGGQMGGINLNLNEMVIEPSLHNMGVILLLMIPVVTMRSFAEEKKSPKDVLCLFWRFLDRDEASREVGSGQQSKGGGSRRESG